MKRAYEIDDLRKVCDNPLTVSLILSPLSHLVHHRRAGRKPRKSGSPWGKVHKRGRGTHKVPVAGVVQRGGQIRRRVIASITGATLREAIRECVDPTATIMTDEFKGYKGIGQHFAGGHQTINHSVGEYSRDGVNVNTMESSFALVKRGLMGIYHAVSKEHLHRYIAEFDFRWNHRQMNDGERTVAAIKSAEGKRLMYKTPVAQKPPQEGNQLPFWAK